MSPRATIEVVAAAAGVSRSTVSRVVNGSSAVSPQAREAVQRVIAELGYVPNRAARSLASRHADAIALIVPEDTATFFGDPFFAAVIAGVTGALRDTQYLLNLLIATDDPGDRVAAFLRNGGVDGALILSHHTSDAFIDQVGDAVPVVWGGRPRRVREGEYVVDVDNAAAARTATEHLRGLGCTRIATITGPLSMMSAADRREGFLSALTEEQLVPFAEVEADYTEAGGADAARRILEKGVPDGLFVASDLMARGAITVLRTAGLRVPEDVAVVGFDDSSVAVGAEPSLTTMRQPLYELGEKMTEILLSHLRGEEPGRITILPTHLVIRASA